MPEVWISTAKETTGYPVKESRNGTFIGGVQFTREEPLPGWLAWCARCYQTTTVTQGHRSRVAAAKELMAHVIREHH